MSDDPELAKELFERLKNHIPAEWKGNAVAGFNERLRFLRYSPGDYFDQHYDGCYVRPDGSQRSFLTVMLYLNDGGEEMVGGHTTFLNVKKGKGPLGPVSVMPKPGRVLIFQHDIMHEGSLVSSGHKYSMRTDIMYHID
jgi:hypothetical protein